MKFSENGNFKKIFISDIYPAFDAQELDAWCDAITKDNVWKKILYAYSLLHIPKEDAKNVSEKMRLPKKAKKEFTLKYPPPTPDLEDILKSIATKHTIDIDHHSGLSFGTLLLTLVAISEAGGRDAYIAQKTSVSPTMSK